MPCLTKRLREGLTDYNHALVIFSLEASSTTQCKITEGRSGEFGHVTVTQLSTCAINKETEVLTFSSTPRDDCTQKQLSTWAHSCTNRNILVPAYLRVTEQLYNTNFHFSGGKAGSTVWIFSLCTQQGFHPISGGVKRDKSSLT